MAQFRAMTQAVRLGAADKIEQVRLDLGTRKETGRGDLVAGGDLDVGGEGHDAGAD